MLIVSLTGCSLGPDKKIFINDVNSAFSAIKNPDSTGGKKTIENLYKELSSECNDLTDSQKSSLKSKCKQLYMSFYSNAKCSNITVDVSGDTANVDSTISMNDVGKMSDDMESEVEKMSDSVLKMSPDELKSFFGADISKLSKSQITYLIIDKGVDQSLASFKSKSYAKTSDLKLVYKKSGNLWNISEDSQKKLDAMLDPKE